ncbi:dihydrodipicolinate synthase family protein [Spirillospora sp. CA-255316]
MEGIYVPLVTPYTASGEVDAASLEKLARRCLEGGATGLVALGTSDEGVLDHFAAARALSALHAIRAL